MIFIIMLCICSSYLIKSKTQKTIKFLGMVRDALGGIGGSSLSMFTGFLKDFENSNFQKIIFRQKSC